MVMEVKKNKAPKEGGSFNDEAYLPGNLQDC